MVEYGCEYKAKAISQFVISDKLTNDYQTEIKRRAGIMGETTESKLWTSKQVAKVVIAQMHGETDLC